MILTEGKLSSWIVFLREIKGKKIPRPSMFRMFNKKVDPDDYQKSEKESLVNYALKYGSTT